LNKQIAALVVATVILTVVTLADAQQQTKIPKIGWLGARTPSGPGGGPGTGAELFRREFSKLGYIEGKNITIEYRYADDQLDRLPGLVDELVRVKIDLLIAPTTVEARAAKNATRTIPIVFFNVPDPVASGLVDSLARPGGNITGFTTISTVLAGKRLELLKETVPNLSRVALLWDPQNPASAQQWIESQLPAREMGLQLHSMEVSSFDKFESAFKEAVKARSAALAVTQNTLVASNQTRVVELTAKNLLPAMYTNGTYVANGALMSYGPDQAESFRRAASIVDKILKGTKPADIPVEQPTKFEFVINLKAAKQIGLTIPPNVLARADRVIK
jgi:putative tryptophan/tyrosine transport system substrate-binding protein